MNKTLLPLFFTRDGVIAVNKETGSFTDEYLPEQRSHLYGITAVYPYCPGGKTHPKPHPPVNSDSCWLPDALKISISPCSQEIATPISRKQQSLHPGEFQTHRTVTAYKGGKSPSPRPMNEVPCFPAKDFQVFFPVIPQDFTTVFFYQVENVEISPKKTKKKGPGKLKP